MSKIGDVKDLWHWSRLEIRLNVFFRPVIPKKQFIVIIMLLMWKWVVLLLRKNHLLKCWGWLSHPNYIRSFTLSLLLKVSARSLEPWLVLWSSFPLRMFWIFINLPYDQACNTLVMSELVLLVATWNCWWATKKCMQGCCSLRCCLSWTLGSS